MAPRPALRLAAIAESVTGLALLVVPSLMVRLLLGDDPAASALPIARVAGIALIGLGLACWPGPPIIGMLVYGIGVALGLAFLGLTGAASGLLLWPAVALHGLLSAALLAGFVRSRR